MPKARPAAATVMITANSNQRPCIRAQMGAMAIDSSCRASVFDCGNSFTVVLGKQSYPAESNGQAFNDYTRRVDQTGPADEFALRFQD